MANNHKPGAYAREESDLNDATERIIREEVYRDAGEASERAG
jgi:hypothetical protein